MKNFKSALAAAVSILALVHPAYAAPQTSTWNVDGSDWLSPNRFELRARALGVVPQENSSLNVPGKLKVSNTMTPELDLTYYFTNNIAAEVIAGTARHTVRYGGSVAAQTWILPPTVTAQYHFTPDQAFSPYVGAGLNYSIFYGENSKALPDVDVGNHIGYAFQAGADYWIDDHWGLNFDVKKIFLKDVDVTAVNGAVHGKLDVDPWLIGAGVAYRF